MLVYIKQVKFFVSYCYIHLNTWVVGAKFVFNLKIKKSF